MLQITVPKCEWFDPQTGTFGSTKETVLQLEHSLVSIHKWEQKWHKPFLGKDAKTTEECLDYIRCMTLTQNVDPLVYRSLSDQLLVTINDYIEDPMTATWFSDTNKGPVRKETITSEIIYYWMISLNIPWECRKWHLNTLLTLIRVCNAKNAPQKSLSRRELMEQRTAINNARRAKLNSKG